MAHQWVALQGALKARQEAALQMTVSDLETAPHIRLQTVCEPAFEGQLVKLLCDIEHANLPSQDSGKAQESNGATSSTFEQPSGNQILEQVSQAFVFFDQSTEKHVGLHVGSQFCVLLPWQVVMTPCSELPVVLAHVCIPQPHQ